MALSRRATYSLPALTTYLSHISFPAQQSTSLLQNITQRGPISDWSTSSEALGTLKELQKYQQAKVPFSNLHLHYSRHHVGTLHPGQLFEYLVQSKGIAAEGSIDASILNTSPLVPGPDIENAGGREKRWEGRPASGGRGGTCTVNNTFFGTVMRSLGMQVMSSGARVSLMVMAGESGRGKFNGWNHLISLVTFEGRRYLVDVGFGTNGMSNLHSDRPTWLLETVFMIYLGPTTPVELLDGNELPWGVTGNLIRLIYSSIPEFTDLNQKCWILQHKPAGKEAWDDLYCFTETEFLPQDIAVMTFKTTGDVRGSFFNQMVFCGRNVVEEGEVVGAVNLAGSGCKRSIWKEGMWVNERLADVGTEVERWEVLEAVFGIVLGDEERSGIRGLVTELQGREKNE